MPSAKRQRRVGQLLQQELADLVNYKLKDPRLNLVTITRVEVSGDLRYARVFVSHLGDEAAGQGIIEALEHAQGYLRRELGQRVRLRFLPELRFQFDRGLIAGQRIEALLEELAGDAEQAAPDASGDLEEAT